MTTIYDINFQDPNKYEVRRQLVKHFKSRLDWHPTHASVNTFFEQWEGALVNDKSNGCLRIDEDELVLTARKWVVFTGLDSDSKLDHCSAELVGRKAFQTGRLEVTANMNPKAGIVPAIWFLTQSRFVKGQESIKPEFDSHEFGTQDTPTMMNVAIHRDLQYPSRKMHHHKFLAVNGYHTFWAEIQKGWFVSGIDDEELVHFKRGWGVYRQPMYPIIWLAVPYWGHLVGQHSIYIRRLKLEV